MSIPIILKNMMLGIIMLKTPMTENIRIDKEEK